MDTTASFAAILAGAVAALGLVGVVLMARDLVRHLSWREARRFAGVAASAGAAALLIFTASVLGEGGHLAGSLACYVGAVVTAFTALGW